MGKSTKPRRTLLIDADTLIYAAASMAECPTQWTDDLWTLHADLGVAQRQLDTQVQDIEANLHATDSILCLSGPGKRWREQVLPTYKSNRAGVRKPVVWSPLRKYVEEVYDTRVLHGIEGDDVLGMLATQSFPEPWERIIVSLDKDMRSVPALLVNYQKAQKTGDWTVETISPEQADYQHLLQTLCGDTADGYSGCPGIGPVKAAKLLDDSPTWGTIVQAYQKAGLNEEAALQQARVARICRAGDYDYTTKEVDLWTPIKMQDRSVSLSRKP